MKGEFDQDGACCLIGGVRRVVEVEIPPAYPGPGQPFYERVKLVRQARKEKTTILAEYLLDTFGEEEVLKRIGSEAVGLAEDTIRYAKLEIIERKEGGESYGGANNCLNLVSCFNDSPYTTFEEIQKIARDSGL